MANCEPASAFLLLLVEASVAVDPDQSRAAAVGATITAIETKEAGLSKSRRLLSQTYQWANRARPLIAVGVAGVLKI